MRFFATISRTDLESLDYADGTTWKTSENADRYVVPDGLILIRSEVINLKDS
jgi:hypothetical protein